MALCLYVCASVRSPLGIFRLGFCKKTNLIQWLCVCTSVRLYVCASVRSPLGIFYESMYSHVYGSEWSSWRVAFDSFL